MSFTRENDDEALDGTESFAIFRHTPRRSLFTPVGTRGVFDHRVSLWDHCTLSKAEIVELKRTDGRGC